ncbi:MAG: hypothetical protein SOU08_07335 [Anaerococcus sp.]|nr:hypothetical protein [Anaerococcus sp.]
MATPGSIGKAKNININCSNSGIALITYLITYMYVLTKELISLSLESLALEIGMAITIETTRVIINTFDEL